MNVCEYHLVGLTNLPRFLLSSLAVPLYTRPGTYLLPNDVPLVVHIPCLLLQVKLDPVVEAEHFTLASRIASLSHKHMLKPTGVQCPGAGSASIQFEPQIIQLVFESSLVTRALLF